MRALSPSFGLVLALVAAGTGLCAACVGDSPTIGGSPVVDGGGSSDTGVGPADTGVQRDAEAGPLGFCAKQAAPVGAADFFCADFDGPKLEDGWTSFFKASDAGASPLSPVNNVFLSPPTALAAAPVAGATFTPRGGYLEWKKAGSNAVKGIEVTFGFNPAVLGGLVGTATGSVTFVEFGVPTSTASLAFTNGGTVDGVANYVGYFLQFITTGGAAALKTAPLGTRPAVDQWTRVRMRFGQGGTFEVLFNDVSVSTAPAYPMNGTEAYVQLGALTSGQTTTNQVHRYDDVTIAVTR